MNIIDGQLCLWKDISKTVLRRGVRIDPNIDSIDTNVGIGINRYLPDNIDTLGKFFLLYT